MSPKIVLRLQNDFPDIQFIGGTSFYWSPRKQTVYYQEGTEDEPQSTWAILHELGHALLGHRDYLSDFNLLQLEIEAWEQAKKLAYTYKATIEEGHIQDCLDTYRDWLYQRSTCPRCTSGSLQIDTHQYSCLNCNEIWRVSRSRKCRTYRRRSVQNK